MDEEPGVVVRGFWTVMAAGLVLAVVALSMSMNFAFGYGLGTSVGTGRMLGALSVTFDGLKALLPLFIAWQWRDGRKARAAAGGVLFLLVAAYGMASAVGFASHNREGVTASRAHLNASLKEHAADLEAAEWRLKALGVHRIGGVIEADIAGFRKDRLWDATAGCTDATLAASREFCKRIDTLRAELALAAEDNVLTAKIEGLKFKVGQLRARGAGREADPQLGEIARATGMELLRVRSGLNWLLAIAVEAVSCFGLFAIAWHRRSSRAAATASRDAGKPWRLVSGEEVMPARALLPLPARKDDGQRRRSAKAAAKANGRRKQTAAPGPRASQGREVESAVSQRKQQEENGNVS